MSLRRTVAAVLLACAMPALAACTGSPPPEPHAQPAPGPSSAPPNQSTTPSEATTPSQVMPDGSQPAAQATPSTGQTATRATSCNGKPAAAEIITLLKQQRLVEQNASVNVTTGPLCADGWQYAVVAVPDTDPLQVVTRLDGTKLTLVTAGTDVCEDGDLPTAPPAIRATAHC